MNLSPLPIQKFFDNNGAPLVGGQLFTYIAGTTTKLATYQNQAGTLNTNPVLLDFRGEANIWLDQTLTYKFVLAPRGDTDPPTKSIWTVDNISAAVTYASLTAQIIGQILWPRTSLESAAGVTPINYAKFPSPWKDISRFVTNNDGTVDVASQFRDAIAAEKNIIIPEGTYRFDSEVILPSKICMVGAGRDNSIIVLNAAAAVGAAAFRTSAFAESIELAHFKVLAQTDARTHKCLRFAELRASRIEDLWLEGSSSASADQTAIQFDGTGTYTGAVDVVDNYIAGPLIGVDLQGTCTTVRIRDNEMYGRPGAIVATSRGIKTASACAGVLVAGNTLQGWNRGVLGNGTFLRQLGNYFEGNTAHWEWIRGGANPRIWAESIGDQQISTAAPIYPKNNVDNCVVIGLPETYWDNQVPSSGLGFNEQLRTPNLGFFTTPAFAAGDYTASGAMTWTVASGNVNAMKYSINGRTMTVIFDLTGTTVGGAVNNRLFMKIPGGFSAVGPARNPCTILNGGVSSFGLANVLNAGTVIQVFVDIPSAVNWTAGAVDVRGELSFEIA